MRRVIKQGSYAVGCLGLVIILVAILSSFFLRSNVSNPMVSATPAPYEPLKVEQVDVIRHANLVDVVARIHNPNPHAGVANLAVTFTALDSKGTELVSRVENSYILPGNIQYVTSLGLKTTGLIDTVRVDMPTKVNFTDTPKSLQLPTFNSFSYDRTIKPVGTSAIEEQRGLITNNSTFDFNRVEVTAIAYNNKGNVVGVGTTFLGALMVKEQREFTIQWFQPSTPTERVNVYPTTNIFREENIIRVIGDPSLLK